LHITPLIYIVGRHSNILPAGRGIHTTANLINKLYYAHVTEHCAKNKKSPATTLRVKNEVSVHFSGSRL